MSEQERKRRLARFLMCRLLEIGFGVKLQWIDFEHGRACFEFSPTDQQVTALLSQVPVAGAQA